MCVSLLRACSSLQVSVSLVTYAVWPIQRFLSGLLSWCPLILVRILLGCTHNLILPSCMSAFWNWLPCKWSVLGYALHHCLHGVVQPTPSRRGPDQHHLLPRGLQKFLTGLPQCQRPRDPSCPYWVPLVGGFSLLLEQNPDPTLWWPRLCFKLVLFLNFILFWSADDLQSCVSFRCVAKWLIYT